MKIWQARDAVFGEAMRIGSKGKGRNPSRILVVIILALVFLANSVLSTQADAWDHAQAEQALPCR